MARTRRTLIDTGMALFAARGFDDVTTDEIATTAGVSTSTFFRYFPTKESLLFVGEYDYTAVLCDVLARQPSSASDVDALFAAFVELAPMMASVRARVALYERVVASSALLRGREAAHHQANVAVVAQAIAERRREPLSPAIELVADIALTTLKRSHGRWLRGRADVELGATIEEDRRTLAQMSRSMR
jgi:AcrR family transcriptional regulator